MAFETPNNVNVIEDAVIAPYVIGQEKHGGFSIMEKIQRKSKEGGTNGAYKVICYPSTFERALEYIVRNKLCEKKHYTSLKEYIESYASLKDSIYSILK